MDIARALAIFLVLVTHATEQAGYPELWYRSIAYNIDRLGVPLFLMLSGALVLKKCEQLSVGQYYRKYAKHIDYASYWSGGGCFYFGDEPWQFSWEMA